MRKKITIFLILLLLSFIGLPHGSTAEEVPTPVIVSISPEIIEAVDDVFTIKGENLTRNGDDLKILECNNHSNYGGFEVISWADTMIKFKFIEAVFYNGYYSSVLVWSCRVGLRNDINDDFTYSNKVNISMKPIIESVSETNVKVNDIITITGLFLGSQFSPPSVTINNIPVEITDWSLNRSEEDSVSIKITNNITNGNLILTNYLGLPSDPIHINIIPLTSITDFSPKIIVPGETLVTINGISFGNTQNGGYVSTRKSGLVYGYYSDRISIKNFELWSDNKIQFYAPDDIKPGEFQVCSSNFVGGDCFETDYYYIQPTIRSLLPASGAVGDEIEIRATGYLSDIFPDCDFTSRECNEKIETKIYFNNIEASSKTSIGSYNQHIIKATIPSGATTGKVKVEYYHPERETTLTAISSSDFVVLQPSAQDELSAYQQYLQQIKVDQAWNYTHGSSDVTVAVIDDGVYTGHPDLDNNMWINYDEIEGNGRDDDGNGYVDDRWGWNFISDSKNMTTLGTHGTMVAGVIGAEGNSNIGITGINWNIKLMPLITCDGGDCDGNAIIKAIRYATDNGADIINLSLAGQVFNYSYSFNEAIKYAFDRNVLVIIAAGNGDLEGGIGRNLDITKVSPVCNDGGQNMVLGVGAIDSSNQITSWSNYGSCIDIYAPGENIVSTAVPSHSTLGGFYDTGDGTSLSAPIISGVAALIKAKYPTIKNTAIRDRIINNSDYQNSRRIVNAYKAISQSFSESEKMVPDAIVDSTPIDTNITPAPNPTPTPITPAPITPTPQKNSFIKEEKNLVTKVDKNLSGRVSGTILLQVEEKGEAWYVYPDNQKKHYLGRPADAFSIMRGLGLGITNYDLNKIPKSDENFTGDYSLRKRLAGKILLQVEEHGEAWYIYPKDLKRYYMGRPSDAFDLMRRLGLGITNSDLRKIDVGEVE